MIIRQSDQVIALKGQACPGVCSGQWQRAGRPPAALPRHAQVGGSEVDSSRVDSMIAARMRVTGHEQAAELVQYWQQEQAKSHKIKRYNSPGMSS
ncbi:MAG: hypothetical protein ACK443_08300 [Methylococcaceae bacterium]|jgi:hypothetical protein